MKRLALVTCVYDLVKRGSASHRTIGWLLDRADYVLKQDRELVIFTEPELEDELIRRRGGRPTTIVTTPFEELLGHDRVVAAKHGALQTNALAPRKNAPYVQLTWSKFAMLEKALDITSASHVGWIDAAIAYVAKLPPDNVDIFADPSDAPRVHVLRCFSKHDVDHADYWRVVWGHCAAGLIVGGRDQMRKLIHDFWAAVDRAASMGLAPFEEGLLSYIVGQRPEDFSYSYGDYEDIVRNHDAPRGGDTHRRWIVSDALSRGLPDRMAGPARQPSYVHDPVRGSVAVSGFPAVILGHPAEGSSDIVPGRHARDLVDWSLQLASTDKQFVDCGAHTGSWTLIMATHFREVYAFEPQRLIYQQLCGNVALNGLTNVMAYNIGLDEEDRQLTLHRPEGARGLSTARSDFNWRFAPGRLSPEMCAARTLDSFTEALTDVGLVKIDVEGLELRVLRGALEVLRRNDLPKLLVECWAHDWYARDKQELLIFLDEIGYRVVPIMGYGDMLLAEKK